MTFNRNNTSIGKFEHKIVLCSMMDEVTSPETITQIRKSGFEAWAAIKSVRQTMQSTEGYTVKDSRESRSHIIYIRYRPDVSITSAAWVFEERRKSPPRWFKVLGISDYDEKSRFLELSCRIVQASDDAAQPVTIDQKPSVFSPRTEVVR